MSGGHLDDNIKNLREGTNAIVDAMGEAVLHLGGDADLALAVVAQWLLANEGNRREELAGLVAFMARRLWNKRSDHVRFSKN